VSLPLTVQILTTNNERTLRRCLESVSFAEDILIVDGGSTDGTLTIAREFTDRVLAHPYENYGAQQNWALEQGGREWVLVVDADEWVSPELRREIERLLAAGPPAEGYEVRRVNWYLGRRIRFSGWQNDRVLRFFRRDKGRFRRRRVASDAEVEGRTVLLGGVLFHEPYRDVADHVERLQRYSSWGARELIESGRRVGLGAVLLRPVARFLRGYLLRGGFLDGREGLILAGMTSFYVFLKYLKAYEQGTGRNRTDSEP
jgi:glycosyltransferase involved in cell wall biosynthesis